MDAHSKLSNGYSDPAGSDDGGVLLTNTDMGKLSLNDATSQTESDDSRKTQPSNQAIEIQKQIDYYFSDENLATDRFLLGKMRGAKNKPVPIGTLHAFKKMRHYQPFSAVVDAAKDCKNVSVIREGGKWCAQRKEPFRLSEHLLDEEGNAPKIVKTKPTGFEEYWTDPPVTPEVFEEEQDLYSPSLPFAERIETALQRYKAKRRWHSHPANIFAKWMKYSGIDSSPKQFSGGMDQASIDEKSAGEIAVIAATTFVGEDKFDDAIWVVDFENVTKGYLSSMVSCYFELDTEAKVKECVNILRNFFNYILHHSVCPEYQDDIYSARKVCDLADKELFGVHQAQVLLPGEFNTACSTLFGGYYTNSYAGDKAWNEGYNAPAYKIGLSNREARQVFSLGMAAYWPQEDITAERKENQKKHFEQKIVSVEDNVGLEVIEIIDADSKTRYFYEREVPGDFKTLGKLKCRSWTPPDFTEDDLPADFIFAIPQKEYMFWVDQDILKWCFVGMKIETTVRTLGNGLQFFDNVTDVKCSFYTLLNNELVLQWKEPKWITREEQLARLQKYGDENEEDVPLEDID